MQSALDDPGKPARKGSVLIPLRTRLLQSRDRLGLQWEVIERDYILSWVLAGISMVEISVDEPVILPTRKRKIIHEYGETIEDQIAVYALEEIVAEKLRAILQHLERLKVRGWSRSRARDYYDLWRVFGAYQDEMDLSDFTSLLRQKCAIRNVSFTGPDDFFQDAMLDYIEKTWAQWLGPLVPQLPDFNVVVPELREQISRLID